MPCFTKIVLNSLKAFIFQAAYNYALAELFKQIVVWCTPTGFC